MAHIFLLLISQLANRGNDKLKNLTYMIITSKEGMKRKELNAK